MKNLLDLRKKEQPKVILVEKVVFKKRSFFSETLRVLVAVVIVSVTVWGISKADSVLPGSNVESKSFSAIGLISDLATTTISINEAKGSDNTGATTYTFDTANLNKIETKDYIPLTLSDMSVGDKIIVQGTIDGSTIVAKRIISFSATSTKQNVPLDTATSTESVSTTTATTTDEIAGTSTATTTDASTTPTILENVGNTVGNILDTIKDAAQNVINVITGTTTATSTDPAASSTEEVASSTPPAASSSDPVPPVVESTTTPTPPVVTPTPDQTPTSDAPPATTDTTN